MKRILVIIFACLIVGCNNSGVSIDYVNEDISKCDSISNNFIKKECIRGFAIRTENVSLCNRLEPAEQERCVIAIASISENMSLCNRLESQQECKEAVKQNILSNPNNITQCERFAADAEEKDLCVYALASRLKNATICEPINDKKIKEECESYVTKIKEMDDAGNTLY